MPYVAMPHVCVGDLNICNAVIIIYKDISRLALQDLFALHTSLSYLWIKDRKAVQLEQRAATQCKAEKWFSLYEQQTTGVIIPHHYQSSSQDEYINGLKA